MTTVRTALIQMSTVYDKEANTAKGERLVRQAADQGAQIVCLQELFNTIYFPYEIDPRHLDLAETIPGPTTDRMQEVAREVGVVLVAPIYEKTIEGMLFNTAPVIGADGELLGIYRKEPHTSGEHPHPDGDREVLLRTRRHRVRHLRYSLRHQVCGLHLL